MPVDEDGKELDPHIVALAKAIQYRETRGGPAVKGATGEIKSLFQFLEDTWRRLAKRHLGDANAEVNDDNERELVYKELLRLRHGPY